MLNLQQAIIVEGKYDEQRLKEFISSPVITTSGFGIFSDKQKQKLIRDIAASRGIIIMTDSDSAGFVIRSFIKGTVPETAVKQCYIPQIQGTEKRKSHSSAEGLLGVEGLDADTLRSALVRCGATILGESTECSPRADITKSDLFVLGLSGRENSGVKRRQLLQHLGFPTYLSANALLCALNCLYTLGQLEEIVRTVCVD